METAGRNIQRLCSELYESVARYPGHHLRAVVLPDVLWNAFGKHRVGRVSKPTLWRSAIRFVY